MLSCRLTKPVYFVNMKASDNVSSNVEPPKVCPDEFRNDTTA
jgi:hypothetical protein